MQRIMKIIDRMQHSLYLVEIAFTALRCLDSLRILAPAAGRGCNSPQKEK